MHSKVVARGTQGTTPSLARSAEKQVLRVEKPDDEYVSVPEEKTGSSLMVLSGKGLTMGRSQGLLPPTIQTAPVNHGIFRYYTSTDLTNVQVNPVTIGQALGCVATSTTSLSSFVSCYRIKKIVLWPGAGTFHVSELYWLSAPSAFIKEDVKESTNPQGMTITGPNVFVPPKGSLASYWINSSVAANALFGIQCSTGAIIDLHVDYILANALNGFSAQTTAGASTGSVYYPYLDGHSGVIKATGRPTIA